MKTLKKIAFLFVLIFLYVFVLTRSYLPETVAVRGEDIRISDIQVIPVGEIVGIKLYTSGVLVVGTSAIESIDGNTYKPYETTEIREGDSIISINDNVVNNTEKLPQTGLTEDITIMFFIVLCVASAVFAYVKIRKYNEK